MQTLFLRAFILIFVALGIAAAHSWKTDVVLHLKPQDFDWSAYEDDPAPDELRPGSGETDKRDPAETTPEPGNATAPDETDPSRQTTAVPTPPHETRDQPASDEPYISVDRAKRLFDRQVLQDGRQVIFIDARARPEFLKGHIENAISLPAGDFGAMIPAKASAFLPGTAVIIYCQGEQCTDSHDVARRLQSANLNISPIFIMKAGYPAWVEAGYPTMIGPDLGWEL